MRKIGIILWSVCICLVATAQENDTATLRKNKVYEVQQYQYVHAFETQDDSCVMRIKKVDSLGRMVYEKNDYRCSGVDSYQENYLTYEDEKLIRVDNLREGEAFMVTDYRYPRKGERPERVHTFFYQTHDSMTVLNTYFTHKRKDRLDSTYTVRKMQDGSTQRIRSYARYNKDGGLVQLYTVNEKGEPLEMITNEIGDDGQIASVAFTTYGEYENFMQTFYTYNAKGQVASTYNTVNQKQVFKYSNNGLITNILMYNPKGKLEIEYIYKYKIRK